MLIADLAATVTFVELREEVRRMCSVAKQLPVTLKWIDDEGGSTSRSTCETSLRQLLSLGHTALCSCVCVCVCRGPVYHLVSDGAGGGVPYLQPNQEVWSTAAR